MDLFFGMLIGIAVGITASILIYRIPRLATRRRKAIEDALVTLTNLCGIPLVVTDSSRRVIAAAPEITSIGIDPWGAGERIFSSIASDALRSGEELRRQSALGVVSVQQRTPFLVRAVPLLGDFVIIVVEDHRESERLDSVRTDFLVNISHEIKTPVAAIGLLSEALAAAADDPEAVRSFTDSLSDEVVRLTRMSRDVIELSRIEAGIVDLGHDPFALADIAQEAVAENSNAASVKNITVQVTADDSAVVRADRRMVTTALSNLVENAIQYSRSGTRVGVSVQVVGDNAVVLVADQGVGIRPENIDRVFERFYREDISRSREGSGLGLSIVKHTASVHQGTVSVSSRLGIGSTFRFEIPVARSEGKEGEK